MLNDVVLVLEHSPWLVYLLVALLGLCIGSFLNVVIWRMPKMILDADAECFYTGQNSRLKQSKNAAPAFGAAAPAFGAAAQTAEALPSAPELAQADTRPRGALSQFNIAFPASHCVRCFHALAWYDLFPVLSFIFLRARCRYCSQSIAWRYPLIEIIMGVLSVWLMWYFSLSLKACFAIIFAAILLALASIDMATGLLPDELTLPGLWLGLLVSTGHVFVSPINAILGALIGYLSLRTVDALYYLVRRQHGIGFGDFKMLAFIGAWVGWQGLIPCVFFASCAALVISLIRLIGSTYKSQYALAFGPYLAIAGLTVLLCQPMIKSWMLFYLT